MQDNFLIMDRKAGVRSKYRHPLSIGVGAEYLTSKTRLAISAEYFFRIDDYHLLEPAADPFIYHSTSPDSTNFSRMVNQFLHVELANRQVLNVGFGFSREIFTKFTVLLGAYTDFSSYDKPDNADELLNGFGSFDAFHISTGVSYSRQKQCVSLGFSYAFTPKSKVPPYTIINQSTEITKEAFITAHTYAIVLGYTYYFAKFSE
jgi:hypothetical protein